MCGRRTAQLLPNATLRTYPDAAHGLFITHTEAVNADLLAFLGAAPAGVR